MFRYLLFGLVLLAALSSRATAWDIVEMGDIQFQHDQGVSARDYNTDNIYNTQESLSAEFVLLRESFLRTNLHTHSDQQQHRYVGLDWEIGTKISDSFEIGIWHQQNSGLNYTNPSYPAGISQYGVTVRVKLYSGVHPSAVFER